MPQIIPNIFAALAMFVMYGSSLLFWPVHRLLHRRQTRRGRAFLWMFLAQILLYGVWGLIALRVGDWLHGLIFLLPLNTLFWGVGLVTWLNTANAEVPADDNKIG